MRMKKLGRTGLDVSPLCLGCMTYGIPERGPHPWTLNEEASRPLLRKAVEMGINFFDTANYYSDGTSEEIVGRALKEFARRDDLVIATKCYYGLSDRPNAGGLSRKAIFAAVDASLTRLGTDYVDLLQIHRWDYATPIEVTLEALHDVVKAGKARYIGASSMYACSSPRPCSSPTATAGPGSPPCRTTTTSSTARRSARCCRCAPTRTSPCCRGARWRAAA